MPEKDGGAGTLASFDPGIQASAPLVMEQLIGDSCSQGKQIKREIRLKKKICMTSSESCLGNEDLSGQMPEGREAE